MLTAIHRPVNITILPSKLPDGSAAPDIFDVGVQHRTDSEPQMYYGTHVPQSLRAAMLANDVECIQMEELRGALAETLPFRPAFLVVAIRTRRREMLVEIPRKIRTSFWGKVLIGSLATLVGVWMLWVENNSVGAVALVLGTHHVRSAWGMVLYQRFNEVA